MELWEKQAYITILLGKEAGGRLPLREKFIKKKAQILG